MSQDPTGGEAGRSHSWGELGRVVTEAWKGEGPSRAGCRKNVAEGTSWGPAVLQAPRGSHGKNQLGVVVALCTRP